MVWSQKIPHKKLAGRRTESISKHFRSTSDSLAHARAVRTQYLITKVHAALQR